MLLQGLILLALERFHKNEPVAIRRMVIRPTMGTTVYRRLLVNK